MSVYLSDPRWPRPSRPCRGPGRRQRVAVAVAQQRQTGRRARSKARSAPASRRTVAAAASWGDTPTWAKCWSCRLRQCVGLRAFSRRTALFCLKRITFKTFAQLLGPLANHSEPAKSTLSSATCLPRHLSVAMATRLLRRSPQLRSVDEELLLRCRSAQEVALARPAARPWAMSFRASFGRGLVRGVPPRPLLPCRQGHLR